MTSIATSSAVENTESRLFRKISWRLLPVLCVCYVFAYLDRTNIGYAHLQMREHLAFSDAVFGLGASVFFVGYAVFEVPSNMLLARIGLRKTLLRIMCLWGVASAAMMFVTSPTHFYVLRFLVGVFEAGFGPGVLYYFTLWLPRKRLAQATALFFMAYTLAPILAGPMAGTIMTYLDGVQGMRGWQWLFLLEGLPCIALGLLVYCTLPNGPQEAKWLTPEEKSAVARLIRQDTPASHSDAGGVRAALRDPRVLVLGFVCFLATLGLYALSFWGPTLLRGMGLTIFQVGMFSTIPSLFGVAASITVGRHSDRTGERRWHFVISALVAAAGMALTTRFLDSPIPAMVCLTMVSIGLASAFTVLWSIPGTVLHGRSAAAGIAIVNTVGSSAGMVAPAAVGMIKSATGGFALTFYLLSGALMLAALIVIICIRPRTAGSRDVLANSAG